MNEMFNEKKVSQALFQFFEIDDEINIKKSIFQLAPYYSKPQFQECLAVEPLQLKLDVYNEKGDFYGHYNKGTGKLPKECNLNFSLDKSIKGTRYWQVVNSGKEAFNKKCLRGDWEKDDKNLHVESTKYKGRHFIRCAVVSNNLIVGLSNWMEICIGD